MVKREYREPRTCSKCSAASAGAFQYLLYHWETLKLMFVGQRHPGQDPGCVFGKLDNDAIRIMVGAVADALLSTESQAVRNHEYAPWRGLLQQLD